MKCRTCKWWDRIDEDVDEGLCRRHPPTAVVLAVGPGDEPGDETIETVWPQTAEGDWCSEFAGGLPPTDIDNP